VPNASTSNQPTTTPSYTGIGYKIPGLAPKLFPVTIKPGTTLAGVTVIFVDAACNLGVDGCDPMATNPTVPFPTPYVDGGGGGGGTTVQCVDNGSPCLGD
jgi:hypothetical protein